MGKGFSLANNPWVYLAKYTESGNWKEEYIEKPHLSPVEESALNTGELDAYLQKRNSFGNLPLVNYTTQYGLGCFEGLKAFPQKDGSLKLFRPDENGARMERSMEGLMMPPYPRKMFEGAVVETVRRNRKIGFTPAYNQAWEKDNYLGGHAVYIRPFTYAEPGIGLNLSSSPWVVVVTTQVGSYFKPGNSKAITTTAVRATPGGTGWIKCDSNYVIPILTKKRAEAKGYMEAIFLDAIERTYVEEGSSCNIFFYLKNGTLVTPSLEDTILPGITRKSVLELANREGISTVERKISIDEAMSDSNEVFVTGTAAGISYFESITHNGKTSVFNGGKMGKTTLHLLQKLKGIQYGAEEDTFGWMVQS
jgi:branched-chain amino acid aminotransferase